MSINLLRLEKYHVQHANATCIGAPSTILQMPNFPYMITSRWQRVGLTCPCPNSNYVGPQLDSTFVQIQTQKGSSSQSDIYLLSSTCWALLSIFLGSRKNSKAELQARKEEFDTLPTLDEVLISTKVIDRRRMRAKDKKESHCMIFIDVLYTALMIASNNANAVMRSELPQGLEHFNMRRWSKDE